MIEDYFRQIDDLITGFSAVHAQDITYDKRSTFLGLIRGSVYFLEGSVLHIREYVDVQHGIERYMYAYHFQRSDGSLVFRYDNTPHFRHLSSFPHHKHEAAETNVSAATPPGLDDVLAEIQDWLGTST